VTRYAKSGELSIAYEVYGDGPIDLVFVPGFVTHLDVNMDVPNIRGVIARMSTFARGLTFDKRGTGLSDRTAGLPTLAERMDDIRAVMDAAGFKRAAIVGMSEGGAAAALFAATYPERVSALVLWVAALPSPVHERSEERQAAVDFMDSYIGEHWGDGTSMRFLIGAGAPFEPSVDELFSRYERNAATPGAAQAVLRRQLAVDGRPIAAAITVPTLLVAHRDDVITPIAAARETAASIVGARLEETDSPGHWSWDITERADLDLIEEFLTGSRPARPVDRVLGTVLFTDIVGSTDLVFRLGDDRWQKLLDEHDDLVRREMRYFHGRELNTTGDGFIAQFDGPARAVQCAQAIVRGAKALELDIRAGLHAGECALTGTHLAGASTLHIGARVAGLAGGGEVLVTRPVRDLVMGSDISFEPRGEHQLKGVPEPVEIFSVAPA